MSEIEPLNIERTVKDSENIDVAIRPEEIGDSVVTVEQDPYVASSREVPVPNLREGLNPHYA